ncbi:hypothetical protein GE21DRAFT_7870 [Neurospora crassa]|uniref:Uncharacterized protein n=1 Tax=Neurospora crassa (strain ATCC 24698 / 74-OR23-1A / CBS 708.71 / DSM 1257 / FGSC 987) TaxID=367110 RepID=V5ILH0_NEUCR|nr:hypothetical protein NCU17004 [Neurospora crassa OR74A]ESA42578.1 hypothetical protein NCU17004 [Neurospora crassa OR74A]KHE86906.1 hypothetical protein GE21DRAFT_7870 [Neurospora crassa]|eukprot:XP_011394837.1 hypothetical protein NCU17004 [Neurospora crassa OR74A]
MTKQNGYTFERDAGVDVNAVIRKPSYLLGTCNRTLGSGEATVSLASRERLQVRFRFQPLRQAFSWNGLEVLPQCPVVFFGRQSLDNTVEVSLRYTLPSFTLASTFDTAPPVMYEPGTEMEPRCKVPYPQPGAVVISACHQVDDQVPSG